jgi:hypothetical protein
MPASALARDRDAFAVTREWPSGTSWGSRAPRTTWVALENINSPKAMGKRSSESRRVASSHANTALPMAATTSAKRIPPRRRSRKVARKGATMANGAMVTSR